MKIVCVHCFLLILSQVLNWKSILKSWQGSWGTCMWTVWILVIIIYITNFEQLAKEDLEAADAVLCTALWLIYLCYTAALRLIIILYDIEINIYLWQLSPSHHAHKSNYTNVVTILTVLQYHSRTCFIYHFYLTTWMFFWCNNLWYNLEGETP